MPFPARDAVRGGLLSTNGAWGESLERIPSGDEAVDVFLAAVELLMQRGVSCVVEYVVRRDRPDDLDRILELGDCVVVMTECDHAIERFIGRNLGDRLLARPAVLDALGYESVEAHTTDAIERMRRAEQEMLIEFPVPVLRVDTTDGYRPELDQIVGFATRS